MAFLDMASSDMASITRFLRSLGNAGAAANAHRACEDRRRAEANIDARLNRLMTTTQQAAA